MSVSKVTRELQGCRILVVEDDYMLCQMLIVMLGSVNAVVVGAVASLDEALDLIAGSASVDMALVDINLHGVMSYPLADALIARRIPFVFATGYDEQDIDLPYRRHERIQKPYQQAELVAALRRAGS